MTTKMIVTRCSKCISFKNTNKRHGDDVINSFSSFAIKATESLTKSNDIFKVSLLPHTNAETGE